MHCCAYLVIFSVAAECHVDIAHDHFNLVVLRNLKIKYCSWVGMNDECNMHAAQYYFEY